MRSVFLMFIFIIIIFGMLIFINVNNVTFPKNEKEPFQNVNVEVNKMGLSTHNSFCESNLSSGSSMEEKCNTLTYKSCNSVSCCGWLSNKTANKCVAGSTHGPTFQTDTNGDAINGDPYYYNNKCNGEKCK